MNRRDQFRRHVAIALVAAAIILLQIGLTRVLSVLLWYHWAFFSISLSMLGVGAPGVWFAIRQPGPKTLTISLLSAGLLIPLGMFLVMGHSVVFGDMAVVYCMLALLPAVLSLGSAVCLLLLDAEGDAIGPRYAYDLLGACLGALVVVPLMWVLPTPKLCASLGMLPLLALALLEPRLRWPSLVGAMVIPAIAFGGSLYAVQHNKWYSEEGPNHPIWEEWTPTARLAIFDHLIMPGGESGFNWGQGRNASDAPAPEQYWLEQDGSAGTPITRFDGDLEDVEFLLYDVTTIGYQVGEPKRVAIVGAGGGRDILSARLGGAEDIHAIELNAGIVGALRGPFSEFSGGVYDLPGVTPVIGEGRSVLTGSDGDYDVIQISMIDSWAATAAGAFSLSENNLYTLEAYQLYWSRTSENGMVATSRWMPDNKHGFEVLRLLELVKAALVAEGVSEPQTHLAVIQGGHAATVLMSKRPIESGLLEQLVTACQRRGFDLHYPSERQSWLTEFIDHGTVPELAASFNVTPPTDDQPFFFQALSPFDSISEEQAHDFGFNNTAVHTLRKLMLTLMGVTVALFFAPFAMTRWLGGGTDFWRGSGFFLCIGLGFMFVEIAWLQRFVLYLGHPSLATTAALGSMLLGAGLGSILSARLGVTGGQRWGFIPAVLILLLNVSLSPIFEATLGWSFGARVGMSLAMLTPVAFTMGFFFPLGMVRFGERNKAWFWAINGAAGVLASVLSLALSMELGFSMVAFLGVAIYLAAWLLMRVHGFRMTAVSVRTKGRPRWARRGSGRGFCARGMENDLRECLRRPILKR